MAYQPTNFTKIRGEQRRNRIIKTAIAIIAEGGMAALNSRDIAERAEISKGLVFKYFPDMVELVAKVEHSIMTDDIGAMREAGKDATNPIAALVAAITVLFDRMQTRESREMASMESYPRGISREIEKLIRAIDPEGDNNLIARAALGVICQLAALGGGHDKRLSTAVLFVLKGIGASVADQRKAMELVP